MAFPMPGTGKHLKSMSSEPFMMTADKFGGKMNRDHSPGDVYGGGAS